MTFIINETCIIYKNKKHCRKRLISNLNKNDLYSLFLIKFSSKNIDENIRNLIKKKTKKKKTKKQKTKKRKTKRSQ